MSTELQEKQWAFDSLQEARHLHELTELTNEALEQHWDEERVALLPEPDICDVCHEPFQEGVPCACDRRD
jgi:hypothetical protein